MMFDGRLKFMKKPHYPAPSNIDGPEGVKWGLGNLLIFGWKMGFHALEVGFIRNKRIENWNGIKI